MPSGSYKAVMTHLLPSTRAALFVLLSGCAAGNLNGKNIQSVTVVGTGNDCNEALQQAKVLASDSVTGSFVDSKKTLLNDTQYYERINEYSGGIVRSYKVLETLTGQPCSVKISAEVAFDKQNIAVAGAGNSLVLEEVAQYVTKQDEAQKLAYTLVRRPEMFTTRIDRVTVVSEKGGDALLSFDTVAVYPSEKWYSDLESFLKVEGEYIEYSRSSSLIGLGKSIVTIAALPLLIPLAILLAPFKKDKESVAKGETEELLCFKGDKSYDTLRCYKSSVVNEVKKSLASAQLWVGTKSAENMDLFMRVNAAGFSLLSQRDLGISYKSSNRVDRNVFDIVEPVGVPYTSKLEVDRRFLLSEKSIDVVVKFRN